MTNCFTKTLFLKMKTLIRLPILLAFTTLGLLGCSPDNDDSSLIDAQMTQAYSYYETGQLRASARQAQSVLHIDSANIDALVLLANISTEVGSSKQAIQLLTQQENYSTHLKNEAYLSSLLDAYTARAKYNTVLELIEDPNLASVLEPKDLLLYRATALFGLKQYNQSIELLGDYKTVSAETVELTNLLIRAKSLIDARTEAIEILTAALEVLPNEPSLITLKGKLALNDGNLEEAENAFTSALSFLPTADTILPERAELLRLISEILVLQGRTAEALVYTKLLNDAFPGYQIAQEKLSKAIEHFKAGKLEDARDTLYDLLEDNPDFEDAQLLRSVVEYQLGNYSIAADHLNREIDPELVDPEITRIAALANLRTNRTSNVIDLLKNYEGLNDDVRMLSIYGRAALQEGWINLALEKLNMAITLDPNFTPTYLILADHYIAENNQEKAIDIVRQGYLKNIGEPLITRGLTRLFVRTGQIEEASKIVLETVAEKPELASTYELAADFYISTDDLTKGIANYVMALEKDPAQFETQLKLGIAYHRANDFENALERFAAAALIRPGNTIPYEYMLTSQSNEAAFAQTTVAINTIAKEASDNTGKAVLASYYAHLGDFVTAEELLASLSVQNTELEVINDAKVLVSNSYARKLIEEGDLKSAKAKIFEGLKIRSSNPSLLALLVEAEIKEGNYREAEKIALQAGDADEILGLVLIGDIKSASGDMNAALQAYKASWEKRPTNYVSERVSEILQNHFPEQYDSFVADVQRKLPNSFASLFSQAVSLLSNNQLQQALDVFIQINELYPDNPSIVNNIAWLYIELDNPIGLDIAKEAVNLAPDTPEILDTYGMAEFKYGDKQAALQALRKAQQLAPSNQGIADNLNQVEGSI